ncbi:MULTISPECIES: diguanylate cyclase [unclassified Cryobacterium]|uniref:GGDEF domain-containing protein n=1 Tax=unclassified Cryobacterium TaxID=2649013 RepID=UPI002AB4D0B9|nr:MULTISPECIES: diguanylate cyclase [unclassified Cryobacterium]MDY7529147.1 diguanylate cyclase [Cryobacterium sp. 10C2]MDY7558691.1 diguanylate cyclase [Cryobacterium sp. 10C3]MEB0201898.1 diguanylate cyclase [Cryobacterium sp. 5I3]MEB0290578.1 diguanylate cyclase [Cryobacterium sp. 10C2]
MDSTTLFIVSALIVVLCGVSFILNTALNRNDAAGKLWSLAFIAGIAVAFGYGVAIIGASNWWGLVVGNVGLVVLSGAFWSGSRLYNSRESLLWTVGAAGAVVAIWTLVTAPGGDGWGASGVTWAAMAAFGALAGSEALRGRLGRNINGRILGLSLWILTVYTSARVVALIVLGHDHPDFSRFFGTGSASIVNMSLIVVGSIAISILRAEKLGNNAVGDFTDGIHSAAGVMTSGAFVQAATDHIERADRWQLGLAVIGADIDNLPEINTAFGRAAGDAAIARFAQTLRYSAPVMALIGHPAAGSFLILVSVSSATEARSITERIQTALVDEPVTDSYRIRLTASFAIADTFDHGYELGVLTSAVTEAIRTLKRGGGNDITVVSEAA